MNNDELKLWLRSRTHLHWAYYSFIFGLLLILPAVFYQLSLFTALFIISIPALILGVICRDDPEAEKIVIITAIATAIFYMTVLAIVIKVFWIIIVIALCVSHDISFRLIHYFKNRFEPYSGRFYSIKSQKLFNNILYLTPFVVIVLSGYLKYPENLVLTMLNTNVDITFISSVIQGTIFEPLYNFAITAHEFGFVGLQQVVKNLLGVFKHSGWLIVIAYFLKSIYPENSQDLQYSEY